MPNFCFYKHPETMEKEEKATGIKAVTKEDFRANRVCQFLSSLLLNLGDRLIQRFAGPALCLFSSS